MSETHHGFLLIGGPADDSEMSYELYFWNGKDMVPGNDVDNVDTLQPLGTIPVPGLTKAEGLAVLSETPDHWQIVVLYDGVTGGQPTVFTVAKSCSASQ